MRVVGRLDHMLGHGQVVRADGLLDHEVVDVVLEPPMSFMLVFEDGSALRFCDDDSPYESYVIDKGDDTIVI